MGLDLADRQHLDGPNAAGQCPGRGFGSPGTRVALDKPDVHFVGREVGVPVQPKMASSHCGKHVQVVLRLEANRALPIGRKRPLAGTRGQSAELARAGRPHGTESPRGVGQIVFQLRRDTLEARPMDC